MPERTFVSNAEVGPGYPNWGAIWAGLFTFISIWSVFGLLGEAIFAGAANPSAAHPLTEMSAGMGAWAVILTIIAMFVAGRVTSHLAGVVTAVDAVIHGMAMFGLSVVTALIIIVLGEAGLATAPATLGAAHSPYLLGMFADLGWIGFVALFTGWLAAMLGASSGLTHQRQIQAHVPHVGVA